MRSEPLLALAAVAALAAGPSALAGPEEAEALHRLLAERFAWEAAEFPEQAMSRGDYANAFRLTDNSLEEIERRDRETRAFRERLRAIEPRRLVLEDRVSWELMDLHLEWAVEDHAHRAFLSPIVQGSGLHLDVPEMAEGVRFASVLDYENYLRRLEQVPRAVDDAIEVMRVGLAEGRTPPQVAVLGVTDQLRAILAEHGLDALAVPFAEMPDLIPEGERQALRLRFEGMSLPAVRDGLERLRDFIDSEYLPACRREIAVTALPDGSAYYAFLLRKMTTTTMTAREIHRLGLREVQRIRGDMIAAIRRTDFLDLHPDLEAADDDALFAAFVAYLRTDPRFYYDDEGALLRDYRDICKRIDAHLPKYFRTLPRLTYGVRRIADYMAPQRTTAYYAAGNLANGEPGWFYVNTYALDQRPKYEMIALAMHEAVPGHHLQAALAQEMTGVPEFRKNTWVTAFGEGWALYAERLGIEMGLYEDPYDDFGRLLYEMWRACRLVVDPGIHSMGMSRAQAIEFMRTNTALSEHNILTEIDRYIARPGQACAYKIGALKIRELRTRAEEALGRSFDLRAFHDVVLGAGPVPLTILERRVRDWIRSFPAGAMYD